jgi:PKD repeat protein
MKYLFKTAFLLFSVLAVFENASAQEDYHFGCGLSHQLEELYKQNPSLKERVEHENELTLNRLNQKSGTDDTTLYIIPIVFHILHENGSENISDAQVIDQVAVLNRDFRLLNSDTSAIVQEFKNLKSDVKIEFRLATKDPWGNCTNGIEHIYNHNTNKADDFSKINQWDRSRYLNVWAVKTIGSVGVAGYAYYPPDVDLNLFYGDGVIILQDYIGRIGTSSEHNSRALTHEIGHWLNLMHPWGNTNDPGEQCGDDYVNDTPETKGSTLNCNLNLKVCHPGVLENVQNYMDYSYCSNMFTNGQVARMRDALTNAIANRSNLITDWTHAATGIDVTNAPICTPVASFYSNKTMICQGSSVIFTDNSSRAAVTSRLWKFEGGIPETSTSATQSVEYDTPGFKKVSLTVTNSNGSDEIIENSYIYVSANWADFIGPKNDNFETPQSYFLVENPENNWAKFSKINGVGKNSSSCYKLNNYKNTSSALDYTEDWFYNKRLGGSKDYLISSSYDLSNTSNVIVSFDYAYATNAANLSDITEKVKIYVSKDCGSSWTFLKTLTTAELLTGGTAGNNDFIPASESQWDNFKFDYVSGANDKQIRFKIEFTASDFSNNFYVDNFNIQGTLGLFPNEAINLELEVYPNPAKSNQEINVKYHSNENPVTFVLRDLQGKIVHTQTIETINSDVNEKLNITTTLSPSCYFLEVNSGSFNTTKKIVVM